MWVERGRRSRARCRSYAVFLQHADAIRVGCCQAHGMIERHAAHEFFIVDEEGGCDHAFP